MILVSKNKCGRNQDTDVENGHVDTDEDGECEKNWENSTDIYTLSYVKYIVSGKLLDSTGSSAEGSVMT